MSRAQASGYCADDPGRGTRERSPYWHLGCTPKRHEATGRLANPYGCVGCVRGNRIFQVREIAAHDRLQKGIEHGRGEALVLTKLRLDVARERDLDVGQRGAERAFDGPLMGGVEEGEEEAHSHTVA